MVDEKGKIRKSTLDRGNLIPEPKDFFYCRGKSILVAEFFMFCAGLASQKGDVAQVAEIRLQILMRGNYLPNVRKEVLPWSPVFCSALNGR